MDSTSNSSGDVAEAFHVQIEQGESTHSLHLEDEGESVPITVGKFHDMSSCSTDSGEYEFDSLSEVTTEKDIDHVHIYKNLLEVGEASRVLSDESESTSAPVSVINDVSTSRNSNTSVDEISLGLDLLVHAFDDYTVNTIEPVTTLSLTHPELID